MAAKLNFLHESDIQQVIDVCDISFFEQDVTSINEIMEKIKQKNMKKIKDINKPLYTKLNELTIDALFELLALDILGNKLKNDMPTEGFEECLELTKIRFKDRNLTDDRLKQLLTFQLIGQYDLRYNLRVAKKFLGVALITR